MAKYGEPWETFNSYQILVGRSTGFLPDNVLLTPGQYDRARACVNALEDIDNPAAFVARAMTLGALVGKCAEMFHMLKAEGENSEIEDEFIAHLREMSHSHVHEFDVAQAKKDRELLEDAKKIIKTISLFPPNAPAICEDIDNFLAKLEGGES